MRPLPDFLPPGNSPKWHQRRWWDGVGYFRARSLTQPGFRDWTRIIRYVQPLRDQAASRGDVAMRDRADAVIRQAQRFGQDMRSHVRPDEEREARWDAVVEALDSLLAERHRQRVAGQ